MGYQFTKLGCKFHHCPTCGFGKFWPAPSEIDILKRYSDDYFRREYLQSYSAAENSYDEALIRKRFSFIQGLVEKHSRIPLNKRVLDIGCGAGFLLKVFQQNGWDTFGLDINKAAVDYCVRTLNIAAKAVNFENEPEERLQSEFGKFGLITLTDALEHFFNPLGVLGKVFNLLTDGGVVFLTVPNMNSLTATIIGREWAIYSPLEHVSYFSSRALRRILEMSGFENIEIIDFRYINLSNIHKKNWRFKLGAPVLAALSRLSRMALEGYESYEQVINNDRYYRPAGKFRFEGDILIGLAGKPLSGFK